jgi:membrane protease subunit (stomatin/prohibitin family)
MGLIQAFTDAVQSNLADQWREAIHCPTMDNTIIMRNGIRMNQGRGNNTKGSPDIISNGSAIMVEENTCMLTIDGGKITNIVSEPGGYILDNSTAPSVFAGQILDSAKDMIRRFTFGGVPATEQRVVYINLQQLPGIRFGTAAPMPYPDPRYNTTIDLRFNGTFEIQIPDAEMAVRFYRQVAGKGISTGDTTVDSIFNSTQYINEFMMSLKIALNALSTQGVSYGQISMHLGELTDHVQEATRENWQERGFIVTRIGIGPVTLSDESKELLKDRLKADTMLGGDVQKAVMVGGMARGIEAAGSNEGGAMLGFAGINMGLNAGGGILAQMNETSGQADTWYCTCGATTSGKFCGECGNTRPTNPGEWICVCGKRNTRKFCVDCGHAKP